MRRQMDAAGLRNVVASSVEYEPNTGCWLWARGCNRDGYGSIGFDGWPRGAHRASYRAFVGEPGRMVVMHRCDTPACVNPDHLHLGTHKESMADCAAKGRIRHAPERLRANRTHCARGHEVTPENSVLKASGTFTCRLCRNATARSRRAAKSAATKPEQAGGGE